MCKVLGPFVIVATTITFYDDHLHNDLKEAGRPVNARRPVAALG